MKHLIRATVLSFLLANPVAASDPNTAEVNESIDLATSSANETQSVEDSETSAETTGALDGLWKHKDQSYIIDSKESDGQLNASINVMLDKPDLVGRPYFEDLEYDAEENLWRGEIYVHSLNRNRKATLTQLDDNTLRVTIRGILKISRDWHRLGTSPKKDPEN